ncbi:hypothetical protein ANHYDRO_01221 [Anaerococcus hydrogenalis DSM 7454]|uniref:Uncharacterized protein n=1 Tax=Anaerococcus hydrogenalis DSM 7454 TaxID=561177 RepID=B6W9G8_9FIRM|nr:hypothetical protein ANHYDRO_01221 [Anaerococcus hydrogenalis DSM 7454]
MQIIFIFLEKSKFSFINAFISSGLIFLAIFSPLPSKFIQNKSPYRR